MKTDAQTRRRTGAQATTDAPTRRRADAQAHRAATLTIVGLGVVLLALGACSGGEPAQAPAQEARPKPSQPIVTTIAVMRDLVREVRLVGRVVPAETANRTVATRVDGFVERLYADFTGRDVRQGEPLLDLYSPMLVAAQQELLLAVRLKNALGADPGPEAARNADSLIAGSRRRLAYWDISEDQIAELERTGEVRRTLTLRAPVTGTVLEKDVVQGQSVMAGATLFRIADLSVVWLEADVFEEDLGVVRVGQGADVSFDAYPGETVRARVSYVSPTVDPQARTGRVRLDLVNAANRVRPGLFGTVRISALLGRRAIVVPRQAALVTGDRQIVFVMDSAGRYAPRAVVLGIETDSLVEVKDGLRSGERIVAAGTFLLDAETNLEAAMAGMAGMDMTDRRADAQTHSRADAQTHSRAGEQARNIAGAPRSAAPPPRTAPASPHQRHGAAPHAPTTPPRH
jgi:multidrug efflux pump subunit AcrA (membrane-fusion protein)